MAQVELKRWTLENGIEWSSPVDNIDEGITAGEYIKGCEANMDSPWWSDRDDNTQYFVEIYGDTYSGAWVHDVLCDPMLNCPATEMKQILKTCHFSPNGCN